MTLGLSAGLNEMLALKADDEAAGRKAAAFCNEAMIASLKASQVIARIVNGNILLTYDSLRDAQSALATINQLNSIVLQIGRLKVHTSIGKDFKKLKDDLAGIILTATADYSQLVKHFPAD